ncbi:MAG: hypothetical protein U0793_24135 [Gemmataceae bacterium]
MSIPIEQALFQRDDERHGRLVARSPGFRDGWLAEADRVMQGFGARPAGVSCPEALFVQPLDKRTIAVVQVADRLEKQERVLGFRFLVIERKRYERELSDPFLLSERLPAPWDKPGDLATITWHDLPLPARTVPQVQAVLKRVKAHALKEGEDPEAADFERTVENSESPALLGGVQILVDGGRLLLERRAPDPDFVRGLWTLLPSRSRGRLYPATFAFSGDLGFDVLILPRLNLLEDKEGYATEEMACEYPGSSYELALQTAAESGDQASLDSLLHRRDSRETLRLALILLIGMIVIVVGSRFFTPGPPDTTAEKAAVAAGMAAAQDPFTIMGLKLYGDARWLPAEKAAKK